MSRHGGIVETLPDSLMSLPLHLMIDCGNGADKYSCALRLRFLFLRGTHLWLVYRRQEGAGRCTTPLLGRFSHTDGIKQKKKNILRHPSGVT